MLELLAQADLMMLPLWAVLLFSATMYPMGFLFGACSECCGGCGRCTRAYDFCQSYESITLTFSRGDSFTVTGINDNTYYSNCIANQFFLLDQAFTACGTTYAVYVRFRFAANLADSATTKCYENAFLPVAILEFRYTDSFGRPASLFCGGENPAYELPSACDSTSAAFTFALPAMCFAGFACSGPLNAYVAALGSLTYQLTLNSCACGACCETFSPGTQASCSENVSENGCGFPPENSQEGKFAGLLSSEWQGAGVDCDPNPC